MSAAACTAVLKREFPSIDGELLSYVETVLQSSADEFENGEEVYEAVGAILHEVSQDKSEDDVREICNKFLRLLKPTNGSAGEDGDGDGGGGQKKILAAPINLGQMAATQETADDDIQSIWVIQRDDSLKVDSRKLEKAEAKRAQKLEKRQEVKAAAAATAATAPVLQSATASQVISKKDNKMESKGTNRSMDVRIENFDVSFGDKTLLQNADLLLATGRRYGFVGRNGLGKTTLLKMISGKQLQIPSHISILHVEQEVVGDDTLAIDSVLEVDTVRTGLLERERELNQLIAAGSTDPNLSNELSEVYNHLQVIEADKAPARASIILNGLGFTKEMQARATRTFSGGWRMRLALARALFSKPDLLLLDEPTNMLDIKAIIWLENYLQNWPTTLLVVSHDRNFLDTVPTDILYLHSLRIETFKGNYEQFDKTRTERHKAQRREYEAQLAHRNHVQEFIDRFRYNANRAASVQSKIKMLEKLPELKPVEKEIEVTLKFPEVEPLNPPVLTLNEVQFKYGPDKVIFTSVNLSANLDSRICIVGENGAGKTTLLKIVVNLLEPTGGLVQLHRGLRLGYFSQHHVDQLDMSVNCVELLQNAYPGKPIEEYRRVLGSFGVSGDLALQVVASLSGGQKSRVALAKMCMGRPNFLVLDEPTNHLDIETIEALGKAINKYSGGVILVSHDERLIRMICKELWVCGGGTVKSIEGGFDEYRKIVERELEAIAG
ncbi:ATP-binding cassette sub-family F member 3 [Anopheles ziemanni]|uniref:ATP-binding cassette sub-family F member 3 n=1 Tax=Anopheles coustani TaxID=139045 RepID=UPI00265948E1|nr:ATP-binding cassette sub-family F member 3 [Anopheles coustani]XP_058173946.1 ATP-binding cassette sub-family F member 3 [Anopheles ziemanni]